MTDLFVSWSDYHRTIERLAGRVYDADWHFQHIVAIGRSGLHAGDLLSRLFRVPLSVLQARSARAGDGEVAFSELAGLASPRGQRVLVVDDLIDTGETLAGAVRKLQPQCGELRTAVLWVRQGAGFRPDYHVAEIAAGCRMHPPAEPYDLSNIEEVARRRRADT
ncbi:MAG TPA: phosphoribosyltransferase family protein [Burkholderiales bacterium]|nr:phosphoribosyltransferase family protein [Burkholderiales bacterium]